MGGIFYLVGPVMLVIGILSLFKKRRFVRESAVIDGTVVDIKVGPAKNNRKAYYPVIGYFDTKDASENVYESSAGYEASRYKVGDKVKLRYLNDGVKKQVCLDTWAGVWGFSFMLVLFGIIFCVIDFFLLFHRT